MKDILIIADFCGPLDGTSNSRFLYLADLLCKNNNVEILTSDFNHETKKYFDYEIENHDYKITMLHEGSYPTNVCLQRFLAHFIWAINVRRYLNNRKVPDVIYCAMPTLASSYFAAKYCEKNNVKFIVDVQDLWPEAYQMVFNIPVISSVVFYPFKFLANGAYKRASEIVAVSDTYVNRVLSVNKKVETGHSVFLGTDLQYFDNLVKNNTVNYQKGIDEIWLAYCGTLGSSYDLTVVFDALAIVKEETGSAPKFIVMGQGPRSDEFKEYASKKGINCIFTGKLPYGEMCALLKTCDITVNPIMHGAAQSIINKHADYAASGLPVLNTQECKEYCELVDKYNMGLNCKNGDAKDLSARLIELLNNSNLRASMGSNARRCAEEKFDRKNSYKEIVKLMV